MRQTISVIIPVYNGALYIGEAIESVLQQTLKPTEIIVVDDASTDDTAAVVGRYPVRYERLSQNSGAGAARNRGVELSVGAFIAFLDADDYWTSTKLDTQLRLLCEQEIDIALCQVKQFVSPDLSESEQAEIKLTNPVLPAYLPSAMLISREDLQRVGAFRVDLNAAEVVDWFARARACGLTEQVVNEVLLHRRIHRTNIGRQNQHRQDYLHVVKAMLDEARQAEPFNPVLQGILASEQVTAEDGTVYPLRAHVDRTSLYALQRLVKQAKPKRILEVGFAYGMSSLAIAGIVSQYKRVHYDILDPYQDIMWHKIGIANMRRAGYAGVYEWHKVSSEIGLPKLMTLHRAYDFAFIDGNHTFDHALIDFFYANKMLTVGGIIVLDDATMPALKQLSAHISTYPCYQPVTIEPTVLLGDQVITLDNPQRFAAFRKIDLDTRQWDWHVEF